jgi:hypothetical protein
MLNYKKYKKNKFRWPARAIVNYNNFIITYNKKEKMEEKIILKIL